MANHDYDTRLAMIERIARSRAGGTISLRQAWRVILTGLATTGLSARQIERLAQACDGLEEARMLVDWLRYRPVDSPNARELYQLFIDHVDQSDFTLRDWVLAVSVMKAWFQEQRRETTLEMALGYIHCCAMAGKQGRLADITQSMLDEYGYDG